MSTDKSHVVHVWVYVRTLQVLGETYSFDLFFDSLNDGLLQTRKLATYSISVKESYDE